MIVYVLWYLVKHLSEFPGMRVTIIPRQHNECVFRLPGVYVKNNRYPENVRLCERGEGARLATSTS